MDKPQYSLHLNNGSASIEFFSSADPNLQRNEAILWNRVKDDPKLFYTSKSQTEDIVLANPMAVVFGPELSFNLISPNYPCTFISTSSTILHVNITIS